MLNVQSFLVIVCASCLICAVLDVRSVVVVGKYSGVASAASVFLVHMLPSIWYLFAYIVYDLKQFSFSHVFCIVLCVSINVCVVCCQCTSMCVIAASSASLFVDARVLL